MLGNKVKAHFGSDLKGKYFSLWGLAFKANTDDMREATSIEVIDGRNLFEPAEMKWFGFVYFGIGR